MMVFHIWIFLCEIQGETGKATKFIEHSLWAKHCILSCLDQEGWDACVVRAQARAPDMTSHYHSAHSESLTWEASNHHMIQWLRSQTTMVARPLESGIYSTEMDTRNTVATFTKI